MSAYVPTMTPERIAELRARWCTPTNEGSLISADVAEMLNAIAKLEEELEECHYQIQEWQEGG